MYVQLVSIKKVMEVGCKEEEKSKLKKVIFKMWGSEIRNKSEVKSKRFSDVKTFRFLQS